MSAKLEREVKCLRAELALRTLMYPWMGHDIPKAHRVHGQMAAYTTGFEMAWRGKPRDNVYEFHTAQFRAFESGYADGARAFAEAYAKSV